MFELLEDRNLLTLLTVNSPLDNNTPGDGLVTLREAIIAANANATTDLGQTGSGADTVLFDAATFATPTTIQLVFGQFVVTESLTISGPGHEVLRIDARNNSRIFDVPLTNADVLISGVTLANGRATGDGGAIRSQARGTITLDQCTISGNTARGRGGGVYARDGMTVTDSVVTGNRTTGPNMNGGALYVRGYDHDFNRLLTVTRSTFSGNSATGSGGGFFTRFHANVVDTSFDQNSAGRRGGAFALYYYPTHATAAAFRVTITGATMSRNSAVHSGGGFSAAFVDATNTTISDNHSPLGSAEDLPRRRNRTRGLRASGPVM
jgi:predicted outer membrane repeat protein